MLSYYQVDLVCCISGAAFAGLILGGLCGLLVGAATRAIRTRSSDELLTGLILGVVPGAVVASTVALFTVTLSIAVFQTAIFQPRLKGVYGLPDWFTNATICLIFVAGAIASHCATHRVPYFEERKRTIFCMLLWALAGGLLSSIALAGHGINSYYTIRSNFGPWFYAIIGFVLGSTTAAVWRFAIAALGRCQPLEKRSYSQ